MEVWCTLFEEMALKAKARSASSVEGENFDRWSRGAHEEIAQGSYVSQTFHILVGQKPV